MNSTSSFTHYIIKSYYFTIQVNFICTEIYLLIFNIKNNIVGLNRHAPNSKFSDYKYIRALLGVASNISFKTNQRRPFVVNIKSKEIEKFASPILFKVYNNKVYALANKIPSKIFNQPFVFETRNCKKLCKLNTPSEFNLEEFLDKNLIKLKWSKI